MGLKIENLSKPLCVRVSKDVEKRAKKAAHESGVALGTYLRIVIEYYERKYGFPPLTNSLDFD